ncbi:MAG: O-antigen translocase [Deltaproteobacteria bacterium]|nr:O-antigen translocase [Deltaproteobacteria bacterium]
MGTPNNSYGQILKATTLVGGSQVINILIGIVRTKFMAVLLGPSGLGLMGMYQTIIGMVGNVTGLGIGSSGVRQIAEAAGSGDGLRIARTVYVLRRVAIFLGLLGMLVTVALSYPLSLLTFGNSNHAWAIALLGITLFLGSVSGGQAALIQGMRRIKDLATMNVLGAFFGTVLSVPIIYFWKEAGIVPSIILVSFMAILPSWWYARKIKIPRLYLKFKDIITEARGLISLGLAFMASSVMTAGVLYLIRMLILRELGMESVGLYQAASTLSTIYIGIVLNAMGMDFYPRLTEVAEDDSKVNRMVNEQTEVGLLIATPGLLLTLTFAPYVIYIFYSAKFVPAYELLRWQILGIFLRVVAWPLGFVLLAKGLGRTFFWTELAWHALHVGLVWLGMRFFGFEGIGIAFFILYVTYTVGIFLVVFRISGFRWSEGVMRKACILMSVIAVLFLFPYLLKDIFATWINAIISSFVTAYCLKTLHCLVGPAWIGELRDKVKDCFNFMRA